MSGLEHLTNDRDGAPIGCRGGTLGGAGVSRPARGLVEIAEIAQIQKASMKWASARGRDVSPLIAQIAEIRLRSPAHPINMWGIHGGLLETAIAENTENRRGSAMLHKALRVSPFPTARRFARTEMNSNSWWVDSTKTQTSQETPPEIPKLPKFLPTPLLVPGVPKGPPRQGQRQLREWRKSSEPR